MPEVLRQSFWPGVAAQPVARLAAGTVVLEVAAVEAAAESPVAAFEHDTNTPRKARRTHQEATVLVGTVARGSS